MSWFPDQEYDFARLSTERNNLALVTLAIASLLALLWMRCGWADKGMDTAINAAMNEKASDLDRDFSMVKARRKTTMKPGGDNDMATIGTPAWVEVRWTVHMEAAEAAEGGSKMKKLDLAKVCEEVNTLEASEKALQAGSLLLRLECNVKKKDLGKILDLVPGYEQIKLRYCFAKEFKSRIEDEEGYTLSSSDPDKTVWYKPSETKKDSIVVKVKANFKRCDITHLMAFAKECHTCKSWIPFTRHASKVVDVRATDGIESVVHVCVGLPGISRDILLHFWCSDSLEDDGTFWFFANSVGEGAGVYSWHSIFSPVAPPPAQAIRASVKFTALQITMTGVDSFAVSFISEVDPYVEMLPQSLINFALRKVVYIAIGLVESLCQKMHIKEDTTAVGKMMAENRAFYDGFLRPKFDRIKEKLREEDQSDSVGGWATKEILGGASAFKRIKRRYFTCKPGRKDSACGVTGFNSKTLKYYPTDTQVAGCTPKGLMLVADAVACENVENGLMISEHLRGGTRMIKLVFEDGEVARRMLEILKTKGF